MSLFAKEAAKLIPVDRIVINLFYPETGKIVSAYVSGVEVAEREAGGPYPLAGSTGEEMHAYPK